MKAGYMTAQEYADKYYRDKPLRALFYADTISGARIPEICRETYLDNVYEAVAKDDPIIIDAGANIGIVTDYFRQFAKKVYALEPSPVAFRALMRNCQFNRWDNVEVFEVALSDTDGEATFFISLDNNTADSLTRLVSPEIETHITVSTITLSTFMAQNNIEYVDFLKMDIEGAETFVLPSDSFKSVAHKIKTMEVSYHVHEQTSYTKVLEEFGFKWETLKSDKNVVWYWRD